MQALIVKQEVVLLRHGWRESGEMGSSCEPLQFKVRSEILGQLLVATPMASSGLPHCTASGLRIPRSWSRSSWGSKAQAPGKQRKGKFPGTKCEKHPGRSKEGWMRLVVSNSISESLGLGEVETLLEG